MQPDVITFTSLINAATNAGDLPAAETWLQRANDAGVKPHVVTFTNVINAAAQQ